VDREALAADLLRNITADVGEKIVDWPAKMVAGHIHALIEATLGPAFPTLATPAPVAPPAGKYVPKVGDVVAHVEYPGEEFTVQSIDECGVTTQRTDAGVRYDTEGTCGSADNLRYLRDSTDAEKRASGLAVPPPAPTPAPEGPVRLFPPVIVKTDVPPMVGEVCRSPAPEAKRPTLNVYDRAAVEARFPIGSMVCVENPGTGDRAIAHPRGALRKVCGYDPHEGQWRVVVADNKGWALDCYQIEPCDAPAPCPPPVAGRMEKDALRDAESQVIEAAIRWRAAYCGGAGDYINDAADERVALDSAVANLATLRSALSRPVRP